MNLRTTALALLMLASAAPCAFAQRRAAPPLLPGGDPHAPVNVDADQLEYYNKEQKAVYSGHVVARQGAGKLQATSLTIFFAAQPARSGGAAPDLMGSGSQVSRMEAAGPVTITQEDEIGVGDNATYDRSRNTVVLSGNVSLTQGPNVVRGDKLTYDLGSGQARVEGRVTSLFVPGQSGLSPAKPTRADHRRNRDAVVSEKRP